MDMQQAIRATTQKQNLSAKEMTSVMRAVMGGEATPAQIGGFLVGLSMKGETVDEIAAAAGVMRELATRVDVSATHLVDTAGTGGDSAGSFNISTAAALVAAACGARVAKHGNRSVSSRSGSADLLLAAGVNLDLSPTQVAQCINEVGIGFMFAPRHHGAMKYAVGPRREMAVRTVFNLLGPLTNPASAPNQVVGVFADYWVEPLARVLRQLGSRHVMVVHAHDGLDEFSVSGPTHVAELRQGEIETYSVAPEQFGLSGGAVEEIKVESPEASLEVIRGVFAGQPGPARDIVALNAGAAIYVCGLSDSHHAGVALALNCLDDGSANSKLDALAAFSQSFSTSK